MDKKEKAMKEAEEREIDRKMREAAAKHGVKQKEPKPPRDAYDTTNMNPIKKKKKESYKSGGKVRGCGKAKRGVKKAKMY